MVQRLRAAGAIILAKSNMAEWAFSPYLTVSSIAGITRNPYDLNYVPAGSSGGTAAAVAANLGAVGLGTDTGNSIRGPSSHNALVGIRPTIGLTSRDGMVPLFSVPTLRSDRAQRRRCGPGAGGGRGNDPEDPITAASRRSHSADLYEVSGSGRTCGARIGVLPKVSDAPSTTRNHRP